MLQSQIFTKTRKEAPADEESRNAKLLIRAGFIHKEMAGVYSYLPLGLRVLKKIENIIREEMNAIGGQEVLLTTLQDPEIWRKSGRWVEEEVDVSQGLPWFKTNLSKGGELGIANTHEEALTNVLKDHLFSYKDLPIYIYQIQNKFRNELRAKSGMLRGREFLMKDLYSFSKDENEFEKFYEICAESYMKIFERVGLGQDTVRTFASGGAFSRFSDEFQVLSDVGEDTIYVDEKKKMAVNKEILNDEVLKELSLEKDELKEEKSIEVGNIFKLGTKYAESIGLKYKDEGGKEVYPFMGSYGIGLGRLMGTVVEKHSDEKGIKWTLGTAPFRVHILPIGDKKIHDEAKKIYDSLKKDNTEVLLDDRDVGPGEKLTNADLIGIPYRVVVSDKTMAKNKVEIKRRWEEEVSLIDQSEISKMVKE